MAPALEKSPSSVGVVLRDASHFTQKSSVKPVKDKSGLSETDLTNTVSLDLDDPEVKEAARNLFLKDPTLAAEAVAEYPELQKYINEDLNIKIPEVQTPATRGRAAIPVPLTGELDGNEAEDEDVDEAGKGVTILDNLLRRTKTSLDAKGGGQFSMLVAVSQAALNSQLFFRWGDFERPEFQTMVVPTENNQNSFTHGESINADMAAPQLSLKVLSEATQGSGSVLFYLNFLGGLCSVWDAETQALVDFDDLYGWQVVVEVNLQLVDLDSRGDEYRRVAAKYHVPGSFGISALVAKFDTARLTDDTWSMSSFGAFDMSIPRRESFAALVSTYLKSLSLSINYSLVDRTGDLPDPTMPPTRQILQTYPYRKTKLQEGGIQVTDPVEGLGSRANKNTLLYLGMTRNQAIPGSGYLPWSANWVTLNDANPVAGCLAIHRGDFIDGFLIPKLAVINKATHFEITKADTKKTGAAKAEYSFGLGRPTRPDSAFAWKKSSVDGKTLYTWSSTNTKSDEDGRAGFQSKAWGQVKVFNELMIEEGTNRISWTTTGSMQLETHLKTFGINSKGVAKATRAGKTSISLASVLDGKLSMEILMPPGWVKTTSDGSNSFGFGGTNMDNFANDLEHKYFDNARIVQIVKSINERLERDFAFVLPGGGNFLMKDPIFNNNMDLLVDLTYNASQ